MPGGCLVWILDRKDCSLEVIPLLAPLAAELEQVERKLRQAARVEYEPLARIVEELIASGGKRLRPALVILASSFYPADREKVTSVAAAVELLHTATLVHDDMIDNSLVRRGHPTLNATLSSTATVLTGDFLFARSSVLAAESQNVRVMSIFAETLATICNGELRQVFSDRYRRPSRAEYEYRIYAKTASLFAAATEAGAVLSGAPEEQVQALRRYGQGLGMAFQIMDDVLDFIGDEVTMGKPAGNDLRQGIVTLPVINYLEEHPHNPVIARVLEGDNSPEAVHQAVDQICHSQAISQALGEAQRFVEHSLEALALLPPTRYRELMEELGRYCVSRRV